MNWSDVLVALIGAGLGKFLIDGLKALVRRQRLSSPEARQALAVTTADQSLTVVARARDELEADNIRLRAQQAEERAHFEAERARWETKERVMRREIDTLERKVRDILDELEQIKLRHP